MVTKEFGDMIENTLDKIEELFCNQITPKQQAIYEDIISLTVFQSTKNPSEHSINQAIDTLGRLRTILEYGDKMIFPQEPEYTGHIFGMN